MADHPLKGLYLTRLYHEGSDPFAVVTDLPREEALEYCRKYGSQRRVGDGSGGQEAYLDGRIETENWLRESAKAVGVDIQKEHPIYFTVTDDDQTDKAPHGMKAISIPADEAILKHCSFTFGDSMGNRTSGAPAKAAHKLQDVVLNADQAAKVIASEGIPGDYIKGGRYIEAQIWTRPDVEAAPQQRSRPAQKISAFAAP